MGRIDCITDNGPSLMNISIVFSRQARAIDLDIGLDREVVEKALVQVQQANSMHTDAHARLMVTRGVKTRPFQHPSLSQSVQHL